MKCNYIYVLLLITICLFISISSIRVNSNKSNLVKSERLNIKSCKAEYIFRVNKDNKTNGNIKKDFANNKLLKSKSLLKEYNPFIVYKSNFNSQIIRFSVMNDRDSKIYNVKGKLFWRDDKQKKIGMFTIK